MPLAASAVTLGSVCLERCRSAQETGEDGIAHTGAEVCMEPNPTAAAGMQGAELDAAPGNRVLLKESKQSEDERVLAVIEL